MKVQETPDSEIIARFLVDQTKNAAFSDLVLKYQQRIYWHIRRMVINHDDADDLIQEVFIKVWNNLGNFREDAKLYTWLYRIATNECITFLNWKKNKGALSIDDDQESAYLMGALQSGSYIDGNSIEIKLQEAILTLPDKQRLVFNLKYFDNMKYEDMSQSLGTSVGALKASYHLAVKKIEKYFSERDL